MPLTCDKTVVHDDNGAEIARKVSAENARVTIN